MKSILVDLIQFIGNLLILAGILLILTGTAIGCPERKPPPPKDPSITQPTK